MRDVRLTKQERHLITLVRILMVLFFLATILFAGFPTWTLNYLSEIGYGLFNFPRANLGYGLIPFWNILAVAFTFLLSYICLITQIDFLRNIDYFRLIIFSKVISTAGFVFCFVRYDLQFIYLVGIVVDGLILLISWFYYHGAKKSRTR